MQVARVRAMHFFVCNLCGFWGHGHFHFSCEQLRAAAAAPEPPSLFLVPKLLHFSGASLENARQSAPARAYHPCVDQWAQASSGTQQSDKDDGDRSAVAPVLDVKTVLMAMPVETALLVVGAILHCPLFMIHKAVGLCYAH